MQQDTHDSVEDAQAAFELYRKAMEWKREGIWEQRIKELYELGGKTSWKLASSWWKAERSRILNTNRIIEKTVVVLYYE